MNTEGDVIRTAAKRGKHKGGKGKKDKRRSGRARSLVSKRPKSKMGVRANTVRRIKLAVIRKVHTAESRGHFSY